MDGLVVRYLLVEDVGIADRAVLDTGGAARALLLYDVAGLLGNGYLEVSSLPFNTVNLGIGEDLDVWMPADLDQLGCENSHRAVVGREGLIELGHVAADRGSLLDQIHLKTGGGKIEGGLDTADAATDDHDVAHIVICKVLANLLHVVFKLYDVVHFIVSSQSFTSRPQ
jgi:hypothetical protein